MKLFLLVTALCTLTCVPPAAVAQYGGQPGATGVSGPGAHVFVVQGAKRTELSVSQANDNRADMPKMGMLQFGPPASIEVRSRFRLKGAHATTGVAANAVFEVNVTHMSPVDPNTRPVLIRLDPEDGSRRIGVQTTHTAMRSSTNTVDPIQDDRVSATVEPIAKGVFRLTPTQPLPAGEYAVALRDPDVAPVSYKSGSAQNAAMSNQQIYQSYVWDFFVGSASGS